MSGYLADFDYADQVAFGDLVRNSIEDVSQTTRKLKDGSWEEANPIVKPIAGKGDLHMGIAMALLAGLGHRWSGMDKGQRKAEMALANLVEAAALHYSKEPWRMTVYAKDF